MIPKNLKELWKDILKDGNYEYSNQYLEAAKEEMIEMIKSRITELEKEMKEEYKTIAGKAITDPFIIEPTNRLNRLSGRFKELKRLLGDE